MTTDELVAFFAMPPRQSRRKRFLSYLARLTRRALQPGVTNRVNGLSSLLFVMVKLIVALALIAFLYQFLKTSFYPDRTITIIPFTNATGESNDGLGQSIADRLSFDLSDIQHIYAQAPLDFATPEAGLSYALAHPQAYDTLGSVSVAGVQIPAGQVLLSIQDALPHLRPHRIMTGTITKHTVGTASYINIQAELSEDDDVTGSWQVEAALLQPSDISHAISDLAYQITISLSSDNVATSTGSWTAFKDVTEGLRSFEEFSVSGRTSSFTDTERELQDAIIADPNFGPAYYWLGRTYLKKAYFQPLNIQLLRNYQEVPPYEEGMAVKQFAHLACVTWHPNTRIVAIGDDVAGCNYISNQDAALGYIGLAEAATTACFMAEALDNDKSAAKERLEDAIQLLQRAVHVDTSTFNGYFLLAYLQDMDGKRDSALNELKLAKHNVVLSQGESQRINSLTKRIAHRDYNFCR